ncbi:murein biosynthesis integral membrane protein MurJ [Baekduia soli]|uniref:Probable lipid II flippase MurJ n=1 Tax=Baekduia soli TaxID=496014 RepID=A0A5B8U9H8_9ACTN|nr:murein biosynthesis integral membrane protein MurJ [Baekduia soli]QEC49647.1 murein biosynthesis integral membrane protein MurJ [Baekduia soli]
MTSQAPSAGGPAAERARRAAGGPPPPRRSFARNTAIFSILTGLSRVAGLLREVLASAFFGLTPAFSAFTFAFAIPNVVRSLFADSALSAAFVPIFTELQEEGRKREAFRLASTLLLIILVVLTALSVLFIATAGVIVPAITPSKFSEASNHLAVGFSRVLFPIVLILGLNGLVVGILQAYDHFSIPALSALVWNIVIMAFMVGARPLFSGDHQLYAYAIGILVGTLVQFLMALPVLRTVGFHFEWSFDWRDPRVKRVFVLMLPVTLGLGLINFNALVNYDLAGYVSDRGPRAIDAAFRLYMLPQGMFSVAIATVLFPQLSRLAARRDVPGLRSTVGNGLRLIFLMLLPAAAATAVLAEPMIRLVYQRGEFNAADTTLVAKALFWFSFSLPFSGVNLLLTRSFFSLQRPWVVTWLSVANLVVNIGVSIALLPFGIGGVVAGTAIADLALAGAQYVYLRRELEGRLELRDTLEAVAGMLVAAVWFGIATWVTWAFLDWLFGRSLVAQVISVGGGLAAGVAAYAYVVLAMDLAEARQLQRLVRGRLGRPAPGA